MTLWENENQVRWAGEIVLSNEASKKIILNSFNPRIENDDYG
jgi:hypothetical protein